MSKFIAKSAKQEKFLADQQAKFDSLVADIEAKFTTGKFELPFFAAKPHRNHSNQKRYNGLNPVQLWVESIINGYSSREWLTFKQGQALGYNLKKGSSASVVEFWFQANRPIKQEDGTWVKPSKDDENASKYWYPKYYSVYNLDCWENEDGSPVSLPTVDVVPTLVEQQKLCLKFAEKTGVKIRHVRDSGEAYYIRGLHEVHLPPVDEFKSEVQYINTLLHELGHSTAKALRKDWPKGTFGTVEYAREEVVVELAAVFCSSMLGIEKFPLDSHSSYLNGWLNKAKEDDEHFFKKAIKEATKIASYVWDTIYDEDSDVENSDSKTQSEEVA